VWLYADLHRAHIKPGVEAYARGRYFTTTGQLLTQYSAEVEERSGALREVLAQEFPERTRQAGGRPFGAASRVSGRRLDLGGFLNRHGVDVLGPVENEREAEVNYSILCPWIHEHTTAPESGTFVGQYPSGATFFHCYHAHCHHRRWPEFRAAVRLASRLRTIGVTTNA
jgi:hypothetical protein